MTTGRDPTRGVNHHVLAFFQDALLLNALLVSAVAVPSSLRAQQSTVGDLGVTAAQSATLLSPTPASDVDQTADADQTAALGPRVGSADFAWPVATSPLATSLLDYDQPMMPRQGAGAGPNVALMGVGAAAVVVGLMIGGDGGTIVAITGSVIGLVGLYRFLK